MASCFSWDYSSVILFMNMEVSIMQSIMCKFPSPVNLIVPFKDFFLLFFFNPLLKLPVTTGTEAHRLFLFAEITVFSLPVTAVPLQALITVTNVKSTKWQGSHVQRASCRLALPRTP